MVRLAHQTIFRDGQKQVWIAIHIAVRNGGAGSVT
jgi:hypothetical protein